MSKSFKDQVYIYHLTSVENLGSILENGLLCRHKVIKKKYVYRNIANEEIIEKREDCDIEDYVPFHWRSLTPFAGAVMDANRNTQFCYILLFRIFAKQNKFKVIPKHPLHGDFKIYDYDQGFAEIDWELMDSRNYSDIECKETTMAECLSPKSISHKDFASICVKNNEIAREVIEIIKSVKISDSDKKELIQKIWIAPYFFKQSKKGVV